MEESLLKAAATNDVRLLKFCLENSISVNSSNMNGLTALHIASKEGNLEIVQELIKMNPDINAKTQVGNTPLHVASLSGREEIVSLLLENNANVNAQTNRGFTPLYMAAQQNHIEIVKALLTAGANPYLLADDKFAPLAVASQQGHSELIDILLTHEQMLEGSGNLTKLHMAVKKEDLEIIDSLLKSNHFIDELADGFTPLCTAINFGCYKSAVRLVSCGADVNVILKNDNRPIHFAAKSGRFRFIQLLVSSGADVNVKNKSGISPLHCAATNGHQQILELLIENGADPKSKTLSGLTPLHYSCQKNHDGCARLLIAAGADVEDKTKNGLTAIHTAAHYGNDAIIKQLINRNADFNAKTSNGYTPLHVACSRPSFEVVHTLLFYEDVRVDDPDSDGWTPLHTAVYMGNFEIVKLLIDNGADFKIVNNQGMGVMHFAAANGNVQILGYLIKLNCDVNLLAKNGESPLLLSVYSCNLEATKLLINNGADCAITSIKLYNVHHMAAKHNVVELMSLLHETVSKTKGIDGNINRKTSKGFCPIHVASKYRNHLIVEYLLMVGDDVNRIAKRNLSPLLIGTHYGHYSVVETLLSFKADIKFSASNGFTAVHIAVLYDSFDIAELLLKRGASPDSQSKAGFAPLHISTSRCSIEGTSLLLKYKAFHSPMSNEGITPIHCCAKEDCVDCAELLFLEGADLEVKNNDGYTPLLIACYYGSINMILFLLTHKVSTGEQTKIGYTALHQAAQQGSYEIVSLLLKHGADPNILCYENQTALDIAKLFEHAKVVDLLAEWTSAESSGPISKERRVFGEPMGVYDNMFVESEDETSDAHTLRRLLRMPKHVDNSSNFLNSNQPVVLSFDAGSTTIGEDNKLKQTKLDFGNIEMPTSAPLVSTSCIFEPTLKTTDHTFNNLYDSIIQHLSNDSKSPILAFDAYANPYFFSNYYSILKNDDYSENILRLFTSPNSNICFDSNGIPLVANKNLRFYYDTEKRLFAESTDSMVYSIYYGDELYFDKKQMLNPSVGVKLRGDGCFAVEMDEQLFYNCDGFPIIEGDGTLYADSHRNLFFVDHNENQVKPLFSRTYQLKKEPKELLTTFDHYGTPLLGLIAESSFSKNYNVSGKKGSLSYSDFFMLNKHGIPLFVDAVSRQLYFDEDENLVTVDESGTNTPIFVNGSESPLMNTVSRIINVTNDAIFVNCPHYNSIQYNYYGFPVLFGDYRQEGVDFRQNGLVELNSKVLCDSHTKKPIVWPLAYADGIFDCMGIPLPSSDLSNMKSLEVNDEKVLLNCENVTGNLIYLPNGFPFCNFSARNSFSYGSDDLLYYNDGESVKPVFNNSNQVQKLAVNVSFANNSYKLSSEDFFYDCFGMPLVTFEEPSLVLVLKEDGRVCVVDGSNVTSEYFLFDFYGKFITRRACFGSSLYNCYGKVISLTEYEAKLVQNDENSYHLKYSGQTGLIYDDRACPLLIDGNMSLLRYNSYGELLYDNMTVYYGDSTKAMHPGSSVVMDKSNNFAYLSPKNNSDYFFNWRGIPITLPETLGSILLRNDDYTLSFIDGVSSTPLYYDSNCYEPMRASVMPQNKDYYYTYDGVKQNGNVVYNKVMTDSDGNYYIPEDSENKTVYTPYGTPLATLGEGDTFYYNDQNQLVYYSRVSKRFSGIYSHLKTPFTDPRASVVENDEKTSFVKPGSRKTILFDLNGMPLLDTPGKVRALSDGTFLFYSTCSDVPRVLVNYDNHQPINRQGQIKQKVPVKETPTKETEWDQCVLSDPIPVLETHVDGGKPLPEKQISQSSTSLKFRVSFILDAGPKVVENKKLVNMRIFAGVDSVVRPTRVNVSFLHPSAVHGPDLTDGEQFATKIVQFSANSANFRKPLVIDIPVYTFDDSSRSLSVVYQSEGKWVPYKSHSELLDETIISAMGQNSCDIPAENVIRLCVDSFPIILAVISRPKVNIFTVDANAKVISLDDKSFIMVPSNSVTKETDIAVQVLDVCRDDIDSTVGKDVFVSPILMIKPLNVDFREHFKCKLPLIGAGNKNKLFEYEHCAHLFSSSNYKSTLWEDMTYSTDIVLHPDFNVVFSSMRTLKFWAVLTMKKDENVISGKLNSLYMRTLSVDYMARFIVYAVRNSQTSFHLICACVTDAVDHAFLYFNQSGYQQVMNTDYFKVPGYQPVYVGVSGGGCYSIKPLECCKIDFDPLFENLLEIYVEFFENSEGTPSITFFNYNKSKIFVKQEFYYPAEIIVRKEKPLPPLQLQNGTHSSRDVKIIQSDVPIFDEILSESEGMEPPESDGFVEISLHQDENNSSDVEDSVNLSKGSLNLEEISNYTPGLVENVTPPQTHQNDIQENCYNAANSPEEEATSREYTSTEYSPIEVLSHSTVVVLDHSSLQDNQMVGGLPSEDVAEVVIENIQQSDNLFPPEEALGVVQDSNDQSESAYEQFVIENFSSDEAEEIYDTTIQAAESITENDQLIVTGVSISLTEEVHVTIDNQISGGSNDPPAQTSVARDVEIVIEETPEPNQSK